MANRLFQGIIHQMTDTVDRTIGVIDENGVIIYTGITPFHTLEDLLEVRTDSIKG